LFNIFFQAQPKHLSCIAVAAFHFACTQFRRQQDEQQVKQQFEQTGGPALSQPISVPDSSDLVTISQSRCSPSDLLRMEPILANKLEMNPGAGPELPVTALSFLRLMFSVCRAASVQLGLVDALPPALPEQLLHQVKNNRLSFLGSFDSTSIFIDILKCNDTLDNNSTISLKTFFSWKFWHVTP